MGFPTTPHRRKWNWMWAVNWKIDRLLHTPKPKTPKPLLLELVFVTALVRSLNSSSKIILSSLNSSLSQHIHLRPFIDYAPLQITIQTFYHLIKTFT